VLQKEGLLQNAPGGRNSTEEIPHARRCITWERTQGAAGTDALVRWSLRALRQHMHCREPVHALLCTAMHCHAFL